jgi:molecular chaperone IbpA
MNNANEKIFKDLVKTFIGIDSFFEPLNRVMGFPKYEILKNTETGLTQVRILLAGYKKDEIEILTEGRVLTVQHLKEDSQPDPKIQYVTDQVIAKRSFSLKLTIADNFKVTGAKFEDGILSIDFEKEEVKTEKNKIDIK